MRHATIEVQIEHTWRGDLYVTALDPDGRQYPLHAGQGGSADDLNIRVDVAVPNPTGTWTLHVSDHAGYDLGTLRHFNVTPHR